MPALWAPAAARGLLVLVVTRAHVHVEVAHFKRALLPEVPHGRVFSSLGFGG